MTIKVYIQLINIKPALLEILSKNKKKNKPVEVINGKKLRIWFKRKIYKDN